MAAKDHNQKITALVPAYNERDTVASVVETASRCVPRVIVVDDGSTDHTARSAACGGAEVVQHPENRGKTEAVRTGLKHAASAEYILLLDADLRGLKEDHLHQLFSPVMAGEAEVTIGLLRSGRPLFDLSHSLLCYLSGQRLLPRSLLERALAQQGTGFEMEVLLTRQLRASDQTVRVVPLEGVFHRTKEDKRGFLHGLKLRLQMFGQVIVGFLK